LQRRKLHGPNFHALRHSHASHLLRAGVDAKVISERLGHSRVAFTLDTYTHLKPSQDAEAARRIDAAMERARQPATAVSNSLAREGFEDENGSESKPAN
jgi:integrase